mmetsp:Transcript_127437/g.354769  ORF Transcript_127437/g.354769 Transcript_127437/m.354769 type:complete len:213 (+) Transcript_127437:401-1039(+)
MAWLPAAPAAGPCLPAQAEAAPPPRPSTGRAPPKAHAGGTAQSAARIAAPRCRAAHQGCRARSPGACTRPVAHPPRLTKGRKKSSWSLESASHCAAARFWAGRPRQGARSPLGPTAARRCAGPAALWPLWPRRSRRNADPAREAPPARRMRRRLDGHRSRPGLRPCSRLGRRRPRSGDPPARRSGGRARGRRRSCLSHGRPRGTLHAAAQRA